MALLLWDIYEIRATATSLNGVMLRGRIRKLCLQRGINVLVENTSDAPNGVRFAVLHGEDPADIIAYIKTMGSDVMIAPVQAGLANPVLSKLTVNVESRYTV